MESFDGAHLSGGMKNIHTAEVIKSNGRAVVRKETLITTTHRMEHSKDCSYDYREDSWERSPKTDYTYSRSGSYRQRMLREGYMKPNMARSSLRPDDTSADWSCIDNIKEEYRSSAEYQNENSRRKDVAWERSDSRRKTMSSLSDNHNVRSEFQREEENKAREYAGETMMGKEDLTHCPLSIGLDGGYSDDEIIDEDSRVVCGLIDRKLVDGRLSDGKAAKLTYLQMITELFNVMVTSVTSRVSQVFHRSSSVHYDSNDDGTHRHSNHQTSVNQLYAAHEMSRNNCAVTSGDTNERWWTRTKDGRLDRMSDKSSSHLLGSNTTGRFTTDGQTPPQVTKRSRGGGREDCDETVQHSDTLQNTVESRTSTLHRILLFLILLPFTLLYFPCLAIRKFVTSSGRVLLGTLRKVLSICTVFTTTAIDAETKLLYRTSGARDSRCSCCLYLWIFLLLPFLLVGGYYLYGCGGTTGGGLLVLPAWLQLNTTSLAYLLSISSYSSIIASQNVPLVPIVTKDKSSSDQDSLLSDTHVAGSSFSDADIERRIREIYEILKRELTDEQRLALTSHQSVFDERLLDVQRQLGLVANQLAAMESSRIKGQTDASTDASDRHAQLLNDYSRDIAKLHNDLLSLRTAQDKLKDGLLQLDNKVQVSVEKSDTNAVLISGLEIKLDGLSSDVINLTSSLDGLQLMMSNCCHNASKFRELIHFGIGEYMTLIATGATAEEGTSGGGDKSPGSSSAFALWLNTQFAGRDDFHNRLENVVRQIDDKVKAGVGVAVATAMAAAVSVKQTDERSTTYQRGETENVARADVDSVTVNAGLADDTNTGAVVQGCSTCAELVTADEIRGMILKELKLYDADKTGQFDFALESAGGSIITTRNSKHYLPRTALFSIYGIPLWYASNSPRVTIQPGTQPGECWAFEGQEGRLVIQLSCTAVVRRVSIEHIPRTLSPTGKIDSAPKNVSVWGLQGEADTSPQLLGNFTYSIDREETLQSFDIANDDSKAFRMVELMITSNHGHPSYTCLYRFRVHGEVATKKK